MHVSLINVLFYLKFDIRLNVDVISQHVSVYGLRLCRDRRLKASGLEEVGFFSWFLWDLSESNRTLTQATSVLGTLWISNCIAPNKPASLLPPKTLIHYLYPMICSPFAKSLSGIVYFRYQMIRSRYCLEGLRILCCAVCQNKFLL